MRMILCLGLLLYLLTFASCFDTEVDSCSKKCESSYRQPYDLSACLRGCRLFSINQLSPILLNRNDALRRCEQDCDWCYDQQGSPSPACKFGCHQQEMRPTPAYLQQIEEEKVAFAVRISPFTPQAGAFIHQYCYKVLSNAVTFIGISSFLSDERGGASVLVKIEEQEPINLQSSSEETVIVASFNGDPSHSWSLHPVTIYHYSNTWIGCVAVKMGLPKWLIASVLVMALCTIFYLCCHPLFDDEDDKKVVTFTKELSISANDIERVPLFTVKSHEAGPLPDKLLLA